MGAGGRVRIGVKLTLATTLLVTSVIAGFAVISLRALGDIGDASVARLRETGGELIDGLTAALVKRVALSARAGLEETSYGALKELVGSTTRELSDIAFVQVIDEEGNVVADSRPKAAARDDRADLSRRIKAAGGAIVRIDAEGELRIFGVSLLGATGESLGELRIGYSLGRMHSRLAQSQAESRAHARAASRTMLLAAAGFLVVGLLLALYQSRRISAPLRQLSEQASRIAAGDLSSRLAVESRDEIGELSADFNHMADRITALLDETASKVALEKELEVARMIQETLVPASGLVEAGAMSLASHYEPASICGGDFWTYEVRSDGSTLVVIGDVTGHGIPAALVTAAAAGCIAAVRAVAKTLLAPDQILGALNHAICLCGARSDLGMTAHVSVIDPKTRMLHYANAGHTFPYVLRADGSLGSLCHCGSVLGDSLESSFDPVSLPIQPGDAVLWYTDGLVECTNENQEQWGERRLRKSLKEWPLGPRDQQPISGLRDRVLGEMHAFVRTTPLLDDVTLVVGRFSPRS